MTRIDEGLTRRNFLKGVSAAAVGGAVGLPALSKEARAAQSTSRVVLIRDEHVLVAGGGEDVSWSSRIDGDVIQQMM
ncbi:MAG: twin-arginine translocation signal domain-containing protein, partial [Gemmatimonadales bacterium]